MGKGKRNKAAKAAKAQASKKAKPKGIPLPPFVTVKLDTPFALRLVGLARASDPQGLYVKVPTDDMQNQIHKQIDPTGQLTGGPPKSAKAKR